MIAAVEDLAAVGAFLDDFAVAAFTWACDVEGDGLGVFAFGVTGAGEEFSEFAVFDDEGFSEGGAGAGYLDEF